MAWEVLATDNFNRDENPLASGSGWTTQSGETGFNATVGPGNARPIDDGNDCTSVYTGRSWLDNQASRAKVYAPNTVPGGGNGIGVVVRADSASRSKYRLVMVDSDVPSTNAIELSRFDPSYTVLQQFTASLVADAVLELQVTGTGTATVLTVIYNGVTLGTYADNGGSALSGGSPGITYSSLLAGCTLDDWEGLSEEVTSGFFNVANSHYVSGQNVTSLVPIGTQSGDLMIAWMTHHGSETMVPPAGWIPVETFMSNGFFVADLYYKVAGGSEPSSYTWFTGSVHEGQASIATYRGVSWDKHVFANTASTINNPETPSITPSTANCYVLGLFTCTPSGSPTVTPDSSPACTERREYAEFGAPSLSYLEDYQQSSPVSASLGCTSTTNSTDVWAAIAISLMPEVETSSTSFDFGIAGYGAC